MDDCTMLHRCMEDAGCDELSILRAERFYASGARDELLGVLRRCRCEQLEALHERQKRLDRLDGLIRETQNR